MADVHSNDPPRRHSAGDGDEGAHAGGQEAGQEGAREAPPKPRALAGNYFMAAGIVLAAYGAFVVLLMNLAQMGAISADSPWPAVVVGGVVVLVAYRFWRRFGLGLRHLAPFAVVGALIGVLALAS